MKSNVLGVEPETVRPQPQVWSVLESNIHLKLLHAARKMVIQSTYNGGQEWVFILFIVGFPCWLINNTGTRDQVPSETFLSTWCLAAGFGETWSPSFLVSPTHHAQSYTRIYDMTSWPCLCKKHSLYDKSNREDYLVTKHLGAGVSVVKHAEFLPVNSCFLHKGLCRSQEDTND